MTAASPRAVARTLFVADILTLVTGAALFAPDYEALPVLIVLLLAIAGWGGVGALIAARAPGNPIGWLLLAAASSAALLPFATAYTGFGIAHGRAPLPLAEPVGWTISTVAGGAGLAAIPLLFLLYPDGVLLSRRWRLAAWAAVAGGAALMLANLASGDPDHGLTPPAWADHNDVIANLAIPGVALLIAAVLTAVASLALRLRRASGDERGAIRWLLVLVGAMVAVLPLPFLFGWLGFVLASLVVIPGVLFGIPFAFSVVLLRYGLYDYEVGMRKRIAAAALTAVVWLGMLFIAFLVGSATGALRVEDGAGSMREVAVGAVAAAVAYVTFRWARRFGDRVVFAERATPHEVLSEFSERIGGTYSTDDVLPRMAQLLASGTGAKEARVWVRVGSEMRAVAGWPPSLVQAEPVIVDGTRGAASDQDGVTSFPVVHQGEHLGALTLQMSSNDPMNPAKERLAQDLAAQAGLVLRNVALIEDLRASRRRIVTAQDERAKRLERDIHDGAQQQLVALSVKLRLAEAHVERDPATLGETLAQLQLDANDALENLRDLARGIYPPLLADRGLVAALDAQARKASMPVVVAADGVGRYAPEVEAAVYFCALEALNNAAKYARASEVRVTLSGVDGRLAFTVNDDGRGFDPAAAGSGTGLQGMADRLEAVGGHCTVTSSPTAGTSVQGAVPTVPL